MISVAIQHKAFGHETILQDLNFQVELGQCLAIIGPSGIGKSTLLRLISGLDQRFLGEISCEKPMAMVFQEPTLLPWRNAIDNLLHVHKNLTPQQGYQLLEQVGLADKADAFPRTLSLGQQRRLALARAFCGQPKTLLLDEPFVSLDDPTAVDMVKLTKNLIMEYQPATVFVTHNKDEVRQLADSHIDLSNTNRI